MNGELRVVHEGGDRFGIDIRGHRVVVDQPVDAGGQDSAPTPTELFVAGLASCVAFYARRYLDRHHIDPGGLQVAAQFHIGDRPARVTEISVRLTPPAGLPPERREAFSAVASACTVHHSLQRPPAVTITVSDQAEATHRSDDSPAPEQSHSATTSDRAVCLSTG